MKTKFELRKGKVDPKTKADLSFTFYIEPFEDAAAVAGKVKKLSDLQIEALIESAVANFGYRAGAKRKNNGLTFTLESIADYLLETSVREGEPTEADVENAVKIIGPLNLAARKKYPAPEKPVGEEVMDILGPDYEAELEYVQKQRDVEVYVTLAEKMEKQASAEGFEVPEKGDDEDNQAWLSRFIRIQRLHRAKQTRSKPLL